MCKNARLGRRCRVGQCQQDLGVWLKWSLLPKGNGGSCNKGSPRMVGSGNHHSLKSKGKSKRREPSWMTACRDTTDGLVESSAGNEKVCMIMILECKWCRIISGENEQCPIYLPQRGLRHVLPHSTTTKPKPMYNRPALRFIFNQELFIDRSTDLRRRLDG